MRLIGPAITIEGSLTTAKSQIDEMLRNADKFTSNEVDRITHIGLSVSKTLADAQMLTNSILQRSNSSTVFDLVEARDSAATPAGLRITEAR